MRSLDVRKQLTEEWQKRKVKQGQEFAILTALIAKGTFGLTPTEHKDLKGLSKPPQKFARPYDSLRTYFHGVGRGDNAAIGN
jgi:DNA-damage-inducible protein D